MTNDKTITDKPCVGFHPDAYPADKARLPADKAKLSLVNRHIIGSGIENLILSVYLDLLRFFLNHRTFRSS